MAEIGTFGDITFTVSQKEINTFTSLKWKCSARYASHDRHQKEALLEYIGRDADEISFSMTFSVMSGVNPIDEVEKLVAAEQGGEANRLVIGSEVYGKGKWVITKVLFTLERFDNKGNLLLAKAAVSLKSYAVR